MARSRTRLARAWSLYPRYVWWHHMCAHRGGLGCGRWFGAYAVGGHLHTVGCALQDDSPVRVELASEASLSRFAGSAVVVRPLLACSLTLVHIGVCRVAAPCSAFVEIVGTVRADGTVVEVRRAAFGDSFGALARAHTHGCMVESSRHASQTWAPTKSSWNSPMASTARCSCEKCAGCVASQVNTQSLGLSNVSHVDDACTHAKQLLQSGGICWLNCLRVWRPP